MRVPFCPASFFPFVLDVGINAGANADTDMNSPLALADIDTLLVLQKMVCGVESPVTPVNVVIATQHHCFQSSSLGIEDITDR